MEKNRIHSNKIEKIYSHLSMAWRNNGAKGIFSIVWIRFWMLFAGLSLYGRIATRLATWFAPPYYGRENLSWWNAKGYISPSADIHHNDLQLGPNIFIDDRVLIYQGKDGGSVELAERVHIYRDTIIQTGTGGNVKIGANSHIQARCIFSAYKAPIEIGYGVDIAPNCTFYSYDHGMSTDEPIRKQQLQTKGGIVVDDDVWIGVGVTVLDGVRIGRGAVIGAGAVVTQSVPENAIAVGVPARVVKMRNA